MLSGFFSRFFCFFNREKTAKIDVAKFAHLTNLKELRLRAACAGIKLPMFVFSDGMNGMKELKQLQKLVSSWQRRKSQPRLALA